MNTDDMVKINEQADAVASEMANKDTHFYLWNMYRSSAHKALLRHAITGKTQPPQANNLHDERD